MSKRNRRKARGFSRRQNSEFRRPIEVAHFYSGSFSLDNAEFEDISEEGQPAAITKRALVMVEGSHTDSQKRKHFFSKDRILKFAQNTNNFLAQGGRVPWQQDHQKTQSANLGDLEGNLVPMVITAGNLPDPRAKHLIGRLGLFAEKLVARGESAVRDVLDGKIKTLSPGIDLATDTIREISATPTPAIVGLSTFRKADGSANFALTMEQAEAEEKDYNELKEEFDELAERFWRVVSDIGSAPPEAFEGQDPEAFLQQAIADFEAEIVEMLELNMEQEPQGEPPAGGAVQPRPVSNQATRRFSMASDLSKYTMAGALGIAEFKRGKDKKPRKRRRMIAGGVAGAGVLGAAGRYGMAGVNAVRADRNAGTDWRGRSKSVGTRKAFGAGAGGALAADRDRATALTGRARNAVTGAVASVRGGAGATADAIRSGYKTGAAAGKPGFFGRLRGKTGPSEMASRLSGLKGAAKAGYATRGGKVGIGLAAAGAVGAGVAGLRRRKKRRS